MTRGATGGLDPERSRLEAQFAQGDYSGVALSSRRDLWQVPAAKGMIGLTADALDGLARFDQPLARFYEAAARWIGGDEAGAETILERLHDPRARRLLDLLRRPSIPVLSMLAYGPNTCLVLRDGAGADPRFEVRNVGYAPGDLPYRPGMDVRDFIDRSSPPAFFLTQMIEWHQFPSNLGVLPCPLIGQTSDFFLHVQSMADWLRLFDHVVVNDHTEHAAVSPLTGGPVCSFPKSFGHPASLPPFQENERPIDVLMTGTMISPYHPDKGEVLRQLLSLDGVEVVIANGHLGVSAYYDLLSRAKMTVSHYRCGGGLVTRSIEASAMGCIPLVQRDNSLRFFAGTDPAIVDYDLEEDGLARAVRDGLARYPQLSERLRPTAEAVRANLAPNRVASQYLRFCTVLATASRRRARPTEDPIPKRAMFWKGWSPGGGPFGDLEVIGALRRYNDKRWRERPDGPPSINERARELLLEYGTSLLKGVNGMSRRDEALALYRDGIRRFPQSLVLRFNFVRTVLHFGDPAETSQALALAREAVERGVPAWSIAPDDDVFPYDYAGAWFNYRRYLDLVTEARGGTTLGDGVLVSLVLASLAHYVARCDGDLTMARRAAVLDPGFSAYRMELARLLADADTGEAAEAKALLANLCSDPLHAVEASCVLRRLAGAGSEPAGSIADNLLARTIDAEAYQLRLGSPFLRSLRLGRGVQRGVTVERRQGRADAPELSLIVLDRAGGDAAWVAETVAGQSLPRERIELIHVEQFGHSVEAVRRSADVYIACNPDGPLPHANRGANEAVLAATAPIATVLDPGAAIDEDLLVRVLGRFAAEGAIAVMDRDRETGSARSLSFRVCDAIRVGGFDPHHAYYGPRPDLEDLFRRLLLGGATGCSPDGAQCGVRPRVRGNPATELVKSTMFPGLDDPDRTRPRHEDARFRV